MIKGKLMKESDIAYIAGLFDGEGSIYYKNAPEKKKEAQGTRVQGITVVAY